MSLFYTHFFVASTIGRILEIFVKNTQNVWNYLFFEGIFQYFDERLFVNFLALGWGICYDLFVAAAVPRVRGKISIY